MTELFSNLTGYPSPPPPKKKKKTLANLPSYLQDNNLPSFLCILVSVGSFSLSKLSFPMSTLLCGLQAMWSAPLLC